MINENKAIVVLDTATIVLDELGTLDLTSDDPANDRQELNYGAVLPFININSYNIHAIDYIKINMNSEIPELFIMFRIYETQFLYIQKMEISFVYILNLILPYIIRYGMIIR